MQVFSTIYFLLALTREIYTWKWPLGPFSLLSKNKKNEIFPEQEKEKEQEKEYDWYIIGRNRDFIENRLYEITVQNKTYVLWKNGETKYS